MRSLREKTYTRGTADFPFQRYTFSDIAQGRILAEVHWHPEMEILQVTRGSIEARVGRQIIPICAGQVAFVSPGQLHSIRVTQAGSSYRAFVFSLDLLTLPETHFFQREVVAPVRSGAMCFPILLDREDKPYAQVWAALERMAREDKTDPSYKRTVFSAMVGVFTAMMDTLTSGSEPMQSGSEAVKACLAHMSEHYAEHLSLRDIAGQVHLHPNYLCALFKDYTGKTVFAQLTGIRVEMAAELLRSRDISVSAAAAACGFESPGFFTRKFKEIMGVTPKQYSLQYRSIKEREQ